MITTKAVKNLKSESLFKVAYSIRISFCHIKCIFTVPFTAKSCQEKVVFYKLLSVSTSIHIFKTSWYINYLTVVLDFSYKPLLSELSSSKKKGNNTCVNNVHVDRISMGKHSPYSPINNINIKGPLKDILA